MVGQCLGGPVFARCDQVPDEALDVLVAAVMQQAVGQEGSADLLHVGLLQGALEAAVSQDVAPSTPTEDGKTSPSAPHIQDLILNICSTVCNI